MNEVLPLLAALQDEPSDTWFTISPDWGWLIVTYFFIGGIAGGSSALAALLDLFGNRQDRAVARLGHLVALPLILISGLLLVVDLTRPERFLNMLKQSERFVPMFKWYSPISFGAWILGIYGLVAFLAVVGVLAEQGRLPRGLAIFREGALGQVISALAGLLGLFLTGYTGVLLAATNRPLWGDTTLLGLLFLLSGVSAAAAVLSLLVWRRGSAATVHWLGQMDAWTSLLELATLIVLVLSLGAVAREVWGNGWGVLLAVGTVLLGILVPLALHYRPRLLGRMTVPSAAVLVILGSFVLRTVVVLSSEAI